MSESRRLLHLLILAIAVGLAGFGASVVGLSAVSGVPLPRQSGATLQSRPPALQPLPAMTVPQNANAHRLLDLWDYASDPDTPTEKLLFSVTTERKPANAGRAGVTLVDNRYLEATPSLNWIGDETVVVEANDGMHVAYAVVTVSVVSSQAGDLIEAEGQRQVERQGDWVLSYHQGADFLWSGQPGDSLRARVSGSNVTARLWLGELRSMQRYFEGYYGEQQQYGFIADWKVYSPGKARVRIDGESINELDLGNASRTGWAEIVIAESLEPGDHELEIQVVDGFVSVDLVRSSDAPLVRATGSVTDRWGTGLADVVFTFSRPERPDIVLRTDRDGRFPDFYGLEPGAYDLVVEPDSNPGYLRPFNPEENLLGAREAGIRIEQGQAYEFDFALEYADPEYRSLGLIRRPLGTVPAIVRAGDTLTIECTPDGSAERAPTGQAPAGLASAEQAPCGPASAPEAASIEAALDNGLNARRLEVVSAEAGPDAIYNGLEAGTAVVVRVPEDTPPGSYDLTLNLAGEVDQARRAVHVVPEVSSSYRFIQLSDTHIRSSRDNRDHEERLRQIAEEVNLLAPAFVVITGDLTDAGSRPEYLRLIKALEAFDVPTYLQPGNHDHYAWWTRYLYWGGDEYDKYVGPRFYSFRYGNDRFVMVDTADYEPVHDSRIEDTHHDQLSWLRAELEGVAVAGGVGPRRDSSAADAAPAASAASGGLTVVLAHYDHTAVLPQRFDVSHQLENLIRSSNVDLYIHGHHHSSYERLDEEGPPVVATGSTTNGEYRVFEVRDSGAVAWPLFQQGTLGVEMLGRNDGSEERGEARIVNQSDQTVENLRVEFILRPSSDGYEADGGTVEQIIDTDDGSRTRVLVSVDAAANSSSAVRVWGRGR